MKVVSLAVFVSIVSICIVSYSTDSCAELVHYTAGTCNVVKHEPNGKHKYIGTPIQRYANFVSRFRILLLISGDINPNPGPSSGASNLSVDSLTSHYTYDSQTLHALNVRDADLPTKNRIPYFFYPLSLLKGVLRSIDVYECTSPSCHTTSHLSS